MRNTLTVAMNRISAAGIRSFKPSDADVLFEDLKNIDDNTFNSITQEYIELSFHEKSLTGWFLKKAKELNSEKSWLPKNTGGILTGEYTTEDMKLFFECVNSAVKTFKGKKYEYNAWCEWFNKKWLEKSAENLTEFLKEHLVKLKNRKVEKPESVEEPQPEVDFI